mmetsp:Transcript_21817/g.55393  ORF Transcript_21817/g.55393 Transcript_21817/m.55393 type:complete len:310 (-) Transcript_21817:51-980(-)
MVEVRLDTAAELGLPGDCYLSLRIGDAQKLSRLSASRTYIFPKGADRRYGKIEVFQRIGSCGVDVDPDNKGSRQVSIGLGGASELRLNVAVEARAGAGPKTTTTAQSAEATAKNARAAGAKDYISKTGIEFYLAEAMQDVLRERPANALKFLAERLMQESEKQDHGTFLPALKGAKAPSLKAAPLPGITPVIRKARPPFAQLPSVGSWLAYKPRPAPLAPPAAAGRSFALLPSVGTWLAPKPQPEPQPEPQQAAPFAPPAAAWAPPVRAASEVVLGTNFLTSPVQIMWTSAQLGPGFLSMGPSPGLMFI